LLTAQILPDSQAAQLVLELWLVLSPERFCLRQAACFPCQLPLWFAYMQPAWFMRITSSHRSADCNPTGCPSTTFDICWRADQRTPFRPNNGGDRLKPAPFHCLPLAWPTDPACGRWENAAADGEQANQRAGDPAGFLLAPGGSSRRMRLSLSAVSRTFTFLCEWLVVSWKNGPP
jgi:hypothetical protein